MLHYFDTLGQDMDQSETKTGLELQEYFQVNQAKTGSE